LQGNASISSTGFYAPKGSLNSQNKTVTFDPTSGLIQFNGLQINNVGMYTLSINIFSANSLFTSQCYSNPITVIQTTNNSSNSTGLNTYVFIFSVTNSSLLMISEENKIIETMYNCMSFYGISVSNIQLNVSQSGRSSRRRRQSSLLPQFIIIVSSNDPSIPASFTSNLASLVISNGLVLIKATINGYTYVGYISQSSSFSSVSNVFRKKLKKFNLNLEFSESTRSGSKIFRKIFLIH